MIKLRLFGNYHENYYRRYQKKCLRDRCAELRIKVPMFASMKRLQAAIDAYMKKAAVVHVEDGVDFRRTYKCTAVFNLAFTATTDYYYRVRAESEDVAREWVIQRLPHWNDREGGGEADSTEIEFFHISMEEEEH